MFAKAYSTLGPNPLVQEKEDALFLSELTRSEHKLLYRNMNREEEDEVAFTTDSATCGDTPSTLWYILHWAARMPKVHYHSPGVREAVIKYTLFPASVPWVGAEEISPQGERLVCQENMGNGPQVVFSR